MPLPFNPVVRDENGTSTHAVAPSERQNCAVMMTTQQKKKKKKKKKNSNLCQFDSNLISICPVRLPLAVAVNAASRTSIELISSAFSRQNGKK
jgi:hypothetical protein